MQKYPIWDVGWLVCVLQSWGSPLAVWVDPIQNMKISSTGVKSRWGIRAPKPGVDKKLR